MKELRIPQVSEKEILSRYKHIKPIISINYKKYFMRRFSSKEIFGISYLASAAMDKRRKVNLAQYRVLEGREFECLHTYGCYAFFKPSIAEVLAQIPEEDLNIARAFEIIGAPRNTNDFMQYEDAFKAGFHVSIVRLYYKVE